MKSNAIVMVLVLCLVPAALGACAPRGDGGVKGPLPSVSRAASPGAPGSSLSPGVQAPASSVLTDDEAAAEAAMDKEVIALIRNETKEPFERITTFDEEGNSVKIQAVMVKVAEGAAEKTAVRLRPGLLPKGFVSYMADVTGENRDKITVLKSTDPYGIVKAMSTNGCNLNHSNADVLAKLQEWEKRCPFDILGASMDWVQIEFRSVPPDADALAREVYDFCPDIVDQGTGSVKELADEIRKTRRLFLWWD